MCVSGMCWWVCKGVTRVCVCVCVLVMCVCSGGVSCVCVYEPSGNGL